MKKLLLIAFFALFCIGSTQADETSDLKIGGQLMIRTEIDGRDFSNDTRALNFASMRTRIHVSKSFGKEVSLFAQFQDSRVFGSEPNTLANTANLDIHQAFVTLTNPLGIPVKVKAGRFEMKYGTERFIGAVGWHFVGRSFDGAVFSFDPGFKLDVFAVTHGNPQGYIGNPNGSVYETIPNESSYSIYGFWANHDLNDEHTVDLFTYYESNRNKTNGTDADLDVATIGANHRGKFGGLSTIFEAAFQTGSKEGMDVSAYLISILANYNFGVFSAGAGFDLLSGTDPTDTTEFNTFSPSFGTNHKFYGFMDYFINIPNNTGGLGLQDINFSLNYQPEDCKFNFGAVFHLFSAAQENAAGDNAFGNELDLSVKYKFVKGTTLIWGGSIFMPGDLMKNAFATETRMKEDTAFWTYLMIMASL